MGALKMQTIIDEYDFKLDSSRRFTLRKGKKGEANYDFYKATKYEDGTVVLRPQVLASPECVISEETLHMIDESVLNAKAGSNKGDTFQSEKFADLLSEGDDEE